MHTAIGGENIVGEWFHGLCISVVVLKSNLDAYVVYLLFDIEDIICEEVFALVEALDIALDASLKVERLFFASSFVLNGY